MIYFTSDLHLGHNNILKLCSRPFSSIEEMEQKDYKLDVLAQKDYQAVRVYGNSSMMKSRTEFQRDRERIVNCKAFRRLEIV